MKNLNIKLNFVSSVRNSLDFDAITIDVKGLNRKIKNTHVKNIADRIHAIGFVGSLVVIRTKIYGKVCLLLVDGQNRFQACKRLGVPFNYEIYELVHDTQLHVTELIAALNTSSKAWVNNDFLNAFTANDIVNYKKFKGIIKEHSLTVTELLCVYLGAAGASEIAQFKSGKMVFPNEEDSDLLLKAMVLVRPHVSTKSFIRRQLPKLFIQSKDYIGFANMIKENSEMLNIQGIRYSEDEDIFRSTMQNLLTRFLQAQTRQAA